MLCRSLIGLSYSLDNLRMWNQLKIAENESQTMSIFLILILGVVDEFLDFADLDKNGFLNYAEYVKAMNASNDDKYEEPPQSISSSGSAEIHQG